MVVGAGYTGTEVAAQGQLLTTRLARTLPGLAGQEIRWMLLDLAPRVLAELDPRLSKTAERVLRRRGVEVLTGQSVAQALRRLRAADHRGQGRHPVADLVRRESAPTRWWTAWTWPPTGGGWWSTSSWPCPAHRDIYACGDCAAVPDLTRPGQVCGMTAQHAQRQGKLVARNVAASLGKGTARPYKHRDLGFLVDLGGLAAAANPLHIPLSGPAANAVTRGYHLSAMSGNRMRVLTDWTLNGITPRNRHPSRRSAPSPSRSTSNNPQA